MKVKKIRTPMEGAVVVERPVPSLAVALVLALILWLVLGTMVVHQHSVAIETLYKQVEALTSTVNKDASSIERYRERTDLVMEKVESYQSEVENLSRFFPDQGVGHEQKASKTGGNVIRHRGGN